VESQYITVTFDTQGGNTIASRQLLEYAKIGELEEADKMDGMFIGWYTEPVDGVKISSNTTVGNTDVTYYAHYMNSNLSRIVYFDPVNEDECTSETFNVANVKSGSSTCMKWRVIDVNIDHTNVNLILDHDLYSGKWGSSAATGPTTLFTEISSKMSTWTRVPLLNYTYDSTLSPTSYGVLTCTNGECKTTKNSGETVLATDVRARVLTVEEIRDMINFIYPNTITFTAASTPSPNAFTFSPVNSEKKLWWLIDNKGANTTSGATANQYSSATSGTWTLTPRSGNVWEYGSDGKIGYTSNPSTTSYAVRPVINIPWSLID